MNWIKKIFRRRAERMNDSDFFEGYEAFITGKQLREPEIITLPSGEVNYKLRENEEEAIQYFDKAIEKGYIESDVFTFRAMCLDRLGYYFDAIDDYNKSINLDPQKANIYAARAIIKCSISDYEGSESDIHIAIQLSKWENENNKYWNKWWQKVGYSSATQYYEEHLTFLNRCYLNERNCNSEKWKEMLEEKERKNLILIRRDKSSLNTLL